jgi:hypothetical protein
MSIAMGASFSTVALLSGRRPLRGHRLQAAFNLIRLEEIPCSAGTEDHLE